MRVCVSSAETPLNVCKHLTCASRSDVTTLTHSLTHSYTHSRTHLHIHLLVSVCSESQIFTTNQNRRPKSQKTYENKTKQSKKQKELKIKLNQSSSRMRRRSSRRSCRRRSWRRQLVDSIRWNTQLNSLLLLLCI